MQFFTGIVTTEINWIAGHPFLIGVVFVLSLIVFFVGWRTGRKGN